MAKRSRHGTRLRLLVVNDNLAAAAIFRYNSPPNAIIASCRSSDEAIQAIQRSVAERNPFNAIFIDKNLGGYHNAREKLGAQQVVTAIEKISPLSHICIHSAETGPGSFANFPFIQLTTAVDYSKIKRAIRGFIATVEKTPLRKTPSKIDLSPLKRPNAVLTPEGTIKVFYLIEGQPLPDQMRTLIERGGRVLNIPEAIQQIERVSHIEDKAAIFREQERTAKIGLRPKKPTRRNRPMQRPR